MEQVRIAYRFADGHIEEIEVALEVAEALKELDRQEYNNTQKETRRHVTFDASGEWSWLAVEDQRLARLLDGPTAEQWLYAAICQLSPEQRRLVDAIFFRKMTVSEYARLSGVSQPAISQRIQTVTKKMKKLLTKTL